MGYKIEGTTITMTRGDTVRATIGIKNADGTAYVPYASDKIVFTVKKDYLDTTPLLSINVPISTMELLINSEDTKSFNMPDTYVYDVQLIQADGTVDTFIQKAKLKITEEVG